jgi:hypothetical protein
MGEFLDYLQYRVNRFVSRAYNEWTSGCPAYIIYLGRREFNEFEKEVDFATLIMTPSNPDYNRKRDIYVWHGIKIRKSKKDSLVKIQSKPKKRIRGFPVDYFYVDEFLKYNDKDRYFGGFPDKYAQHYWKTKLADV